MSRNTTLSPADVERLLSDRSVKARAETVEKIAEGFEKNGFSEAERAQATEIFRILANDAEVLVRRTMAESLKSIPNLPHDLAVTLAGDIADVATPMLSYSDALSDKDLFEIISSKSDLHQMAVASRQTVSEAVSGKLAETGNENVVATLMGNEGAEISEATYSKVLEKFGGSEKVNAPMAHRQSLPLTITERLVTLVSDRLREHLVSHHEMSPDMATDLILESREKTMVGLLGDGADHQSLVSLIDQLYEHGRLTSTIILRALCVGDVDFFENSLSKMTGVPVSNVHILINDAGGKGLAQLCKKSKMSEGLQEIMRVALDVADEMDYDGNPGDRARYRNSMIERVLTHFEERIGAEDVDYLISKVHHASSGED